MVCGKLAKNPVKSQLKLNNPVKIQLSWHVYRNNWEYLKTGTESLIGNSTEYDGITNSKLKVKKEYESVTSSEVKYSKTKTLFQSIQILITKRNHHPVHRRYSKCSEMS